MPTYNSNSINYYSYLKALLGDSEEKNKGENSLVEADQAKHDEFLMKLNEGNEFIFKRVKNFLDKKDARICKTYPKEFLLPVYLAEDHHQLKDIRNFREKERIPVICYIHRKKEGGYTSIWRSGQIKTGIMNNSASADEKLITYIGEMTTNPKNIDKKAYVFDCRPYLNAYSNKIAGKGFISDKNYNVHEVNFGKIENIHYMRNAFDTLLKSVECFDKNKSAVGDWFYCLKLILKGAMLVRDYILAGDSVIVNCSDGWDRTPQIICLSKMLLEPYYRTLEGFRVLLHYEWMGFGHKFHSRQQYGKENKDESPIFIQFLDCVHQMIHQSPQKFEFSQKLPIVLAKAYIENMFSEFHSDSTEQYLDYLHQAKKDSSNTGALSIWSMIMAKKDSFINPNYMKENCADNQDHLAVMDVDDDYFSLRVWTEVYGSFQPGHHRKNRKKCSFIRPVEEEFKQ